MKIIPPRFSVRLVDDPSPPTSPPTLPRQNRVLQNGRNMRFQRAAPKGKGLFLRRYRLSATSDILFACVYRGLYGTNRSYPAADKKQTALHHSVVYKYLFHLSDRLSARRRYGYYTRFFSFRQQKRTPNTKIRFRFRRSFAFSAYFALFSFIKETISARSRVFSVAFLSASAAASAAAFAACSSARRFCSAASARSAS